MENSDPTTGNQNTQSSAGQTVEKPAEKPVEAPAWTAQLEENLKNDASLTKFKTLSELGKAYKNLEGKLGSAITPPGENASEEEVRAFYKKLGAPEKAEEYSFIGEVPKPLKDLELEKTFKEIAHVSGLTQKQAQTIYQKYNDAITQMYNKVEESRKFAKQQTEEALKKEWGSNFNENKGYFQRAFEHFGNPKIAAMFDESGLSNNPDVVKMFAAIGKEIGESPLLTGKSQGELKRPEEVLYGKS